MDTNDLLPIFNGDKRRKETIESPQQIMDSARENEITHTKVLSLSKKKNYTTSGDFTLTSTLEDFDMPEARDWFIRFVTCTYKGAPMSNGAVYKALGGSDDEFRQLFTLFFQDLPIHPFVFMSPFQAKTANDEQFFMILQQSDSEFLKNMDADPSMYLRRIVTSGMLCVFILCL